VHPDFAESLRAARVAGIIGAEVFTGKIIKGRVLPMNKKAWAAKFKRYAILAGVNEPKKSCHGVRKTRAEVAAYADCTESQMMAMFGWTDPKMPAHYIAKANREKLGMSGMDKIVAFDQSQPLEDFAPLPDANSAGTPEANNVVTLRSNFGKKAAVISGDCAWVWCARRDSNPHDVTHCHLKAARLPIPPRALKRTIQCRRFYCVDGADVTNREWGDKARWRPDGGFA
jgi:hypothetical protein